MSNTYNRTCQTKCCNSIKANIHTCKHIGRTSCSLELTPNAARCRCCHLQKIFSSVVWQVLCQLTCPMYNIKANIHTRKPTSRTHCSLEFKPNAARATPCRKYSAVVLFSRNYVRSHVPYITSDLPNQVLQLDQGKHSYMQAYRQETLQPGIDTQRCTLQVLPLTEDIQ
jgi:hypothetical protein